MTSKQVLVFLFVLLFVPLTNPTLAATQTVTIASSDWGFVQETATGSGAFVSGPSTAPLGDGSASITLAATGGYLIGSQLHAGTRFDTITSLQYATYQTSANSAVAIALQFNVDYDLTDANTAWQGRLIYEPYRTETLQQDTWQTWSPLTGKWWASGAPGNTAGNCPQSSPCTWADLLTKFPNAGIQTGALSGIVLKAGSGWGAVFTGYVDALTIGISGTETTYDFEPTTQCTSACYVSTTGNDLNGGTSWSDAKKTIQQGIDQVSASGTVYVEAGTYTENITVNKEIAITGQVGTIITKTMTTIPVDISKLGVVQIAANNIMLTNLEIRPINMAGISVGQFTLSTGVSVSNLTLDTVKVIGTNSSPCGEQERGLYVDNTSTINGLTITDSVFQDLVYGWYLQKSVNAVASTVTNVTVTNTTFAHNGLKGLYAEKLSNATFSGTFINNGYYNVSALACSYFDPWRSGIDINLKAGNYSNLVFDTVVVDTNGIGAINGVGIAIKARNDGATYSPFPATLDTVTINSGQIINNERGIRIGEPGKNNNGPTNVVIQGCTQIDNNTNGGLINEALSTLDAKNNWWGDATGPAGIGAGIGDSITLTSTGSVLFDPWGTSAICLNLTPTATATSSNTASATATPSNTATPSSTITPSNTRTSGGGGGGGSKRPPRGVEYFSVDEEFGGVTIETDFCSSPVNKYFTYSPVGLRLVAPKYSLTIFADTYTEKTTLYVKSLAQSKNQQPTYATIIPVCQGSVYIGSQVQGNEYVGKPVRFSFSYGDYLLPAGVTLDQLAFHYYNASMKQWVRIPTILDTTNKTITGATNMLGEIALFAVPLALSASGSQEVTTTSVSPLFNAQWITQTTGKLGGNDPLVGKRGQTIEGSAVFQNRGTTPWKNAGNQFVGFYVYKDPIYSTPLEFNNPANPLFGNSFFANIIAWGPSFDGNALASRASVLKENLVLPGEKGTFNFSFTVPENAPISLAEDSTSTVYNDTFYREDLTLAFGSNWMTNTTNGDPFGRAHVWFPVKVVQ